MHPKWIYVLLTCGYSSALLAQAPHDQPYQTEFDQFEQTIERGFTRFTDSIDLQFARLLSEAWNPFSLENGISFPSNPDKPSTQPHSEGETVIAPQFAIEEIQVTLPDLKEEAREAHQWQVRSPATNDVAPPKVKETAWSVNFYGTRLSVNASTIPGFQIDKPYNKSIPKAWKRLSQWDFRSVLRQINQQALQLNTANWGFFKIAESVAKAMLPNQEDKQVLLTCFLLNKAGIKARLAYDQNRLYLLAASRQEIFEWNFLRMDGQKYYILSHDHGKSGRQKIIYTYRMDYPGTRYRLDFTQTKPPRLHFKPGTRTISFSWEGKIYRKTLAYNQALVQFYQDLPPLGFKTSLASTLSEKSLLGFQQLLDPILESMPTDERVNFLLYFVQEAFPYRTDEEQFGKEKYFYPEEVLHFPYADCEDRSALFACLVREFTRQEVIGLVFPGHVATAVSIPGKKDGSFITHNGKNYWICDPTYRGASVGQCMPRFASAKVDLLVLR